MLLIHIHCSGDGEVPQNYVVGLRRASWKRWYQSRVLGDEGRGSWGTGTCADTQGHTVAWRAQDTWAAGEKLTLGLKPFKNKNPFFLVPYLWESDIFIKGLWFLLEEITTIL